MKKTFSIILVLAMIACMIPAFVISSSADAPTITVDGKLDDWAGLDSVKAETADERNVTFYAVKTADGLYLAADAYHGVYKTTDFGTWFENTNFEIFVKNAGATTGQEQYFISAHNKASMTEPAIADKKGGDLCVDEGAMLTEEVTDGGAVHYHTTAEMFIAKEHLPADVYGLPEITVGMAWKTVGDEANMYGRNNENWWYFRDATPNPARKFVVNEQGVRYIANSTGVQQAGDYSGAWTVADGVYTNTTRATGSTDGNSFATYVLGNAKCVDFTTKVNLSDGKEYAIMVGMTDVNGDKILDECRDAYYLIDLKDGDNGRIGIEKNLANWGGWAAETADNAMPKDRDVEVRVTKDGANIKFYVDGTQVIDYTDNEYPLQGAGYGFAIKPSDGAVFTLVADDSADPADPTETGEPTETDEPADPTDTNEPADPTNAQTGDLAAIAIAAAAVISLAGVAVVASKRKIER